MLWSKAPINKALGLVFILIGIWLGISRVGHTQLLEEPFSTLWLDNGFWQEMMPLIYYAGLMLGGVFILFDNKFSHLVLFFVATLTIEEILSGFISPMAASFPPVAKAILAVANVYLLVLVFKTQRHRPTNKKISHRMVIVGMALALVSTVAYELFFGENALPNRQIIVFYLGAVFSLGIGLVPLCRVVVKSVSDKMLLLYNLLRRPISWMLLMGLMVGACWLWVQQMVFPYWTLVPVLLAGLGLILSYRILVPGSEGKAVDLSSVLEILSVPKNVANKSNDHKTIKP